MGSLYRHGCVLPIGGRAAQHHFTRMKMSCGSNSRSSLSHCQITHCQKTIRRELLSVNKYSNSSCLHVKQPALLREPGQTSHSCGAKCVLTGTRRVGYGSSEQIPEACLKAQSPGAPEWLTSPWLHTSRRRHHYYLYDEVNIY